MKKLLTICVLLTTVSFAHAQKGNWYIGGVAGFGSSANKQQPSGFTTTTSNWAFGPEVGTFLADDIQLGLFLGLSGESVKTDNGDISSTSTLTPTVYGRKFFKVTDNFSVFAGLYLSYLSQTQEDLTVTPVDKSTGSGFGARVGVGIAYALSPRFTAVGQYGLLGFSSISRKNNDVDAGSTTSFDFGVNTIGYSGFSQGNGSGAVFNIGLYYTLKQAN